MPIYEYECKKCGEITEVWQKFSDSPLTDCPHCHGRMNKVMSLNSFHLKGSGWYVTDYSRKTAASQSSTKTTSEPVADTKTDTTKKSDTGTKTSTET